MTDDNPLRALDPRKAAVVIDAGRTAYAEELRRATDAGLEEEEARARARDASRRARLALLKTMMQGGPR